LPASVNNIHYTVIVFLVVEIHTLMPGSAICIVYIYSHEMKYELHIAKKVLDCKYFWRVLL